MNIPGHFRIANFRQFLGTATILALLMLQTGCESERAKWNLARAINLQQEGKFDQAIMLTQKAKEQDPENCQIKLYLASMLAENGCGEVAVALCDEHHDCFPNDLAARQIRSTCLRNLGRFDEALDEYKKSLSGHVSRTSAELNDLSYFRALANKELTKASADIREAVGQLEGKYWGAYKLPLEVRAVVAGGLISRHVDTRDSVLPVLNRMIRKHEAGLAILDEHVTAVVTNSVRSKLPLSKQQEKNALNIRAIRELQKISLASMLTTRALMLEDREQTECVDADRRRIHELGFDVERVGRELPGDPQCLAALRMATIYLDTRGFIASRQPWYAPSNGINLEDLLSESISHSNYELAISDLDVAVMSAQVSREALNSALYNTMNEPPEYMVRKKAISRRMTAILMYHRMTTHQRAGNKKAAAKDRCRIEALGFAPDEGLF